MLVDLPPHIFPDLEAPLPDFEHRASKVGKAVALPHVEFA
jgi:hypothetical protein